MDQMTASDIVLIVVTAISTAFAAQVGRGIWSRLFGSTYVTEDRCHSRREDCHREHTSEATDAATELREIRRILILLCQKNGIDPNNYTGIIR